METKRFFFVVGMPRTRTAWLSVLLTGSDSLCFHEGTLGLDWDAYEVKLNERPEGFVGDSNPGLIGCIDDVLRRFPNARFAVVRRDPAEALESFCAAFPDAAVQMRAGWVRYMELFEDAVARLPHRVEATFEDLETFEVCDRLHRHLLDTPLERARWEQLNKLHITTSAPPVQSPAPERIEVEVSVDGFEFAGLTVRSYAPDDRPMLERWYQEHKEEPMPVVHLPPLGLIVEDAQGPAAALWCFETYGAGVAWIALPVTCPGLSYARVCEVMAFGIMAITKLAGSGYVPRAHFDCFRVICPPSMGRLLTRLGFTEQPHRSNYFLSV